MTNVREFETALLKRSMKFDVDGGICHPFVSGYLISFLEELAEKFPGLDESLKERAKTLTNMIGELK